MRNSSDRISYVTAQRDYDHAEDPSLDDSDEKPTHDEYWNGLDEMEDDDA